MENADILSGLAKKETKAEDIAERVLKKPGLLPELFVGISSTNPRVMFGSAKILRTISEKDPNMLYSRIDFFENLLHSENNILKWNAIDIVANLTVADSLNKFDRFFSRFFGHLYEGSLITASHVVDNSGRIALAKPELQDKITQELLKVEEVPLPTEECRNILIGKTMKAFDAYYDKIKDKDKVISFVKRQLNNSRRATRAKAEKFLKKIEKQSMNI